MLWLLFQSECSLSNSSGEFLPLGVFSFFVFFEFIQPHVLWWGFYFLFNLKSGQEIYFYTMSLRSPNCLWEVPPGCWQSTEQWTWTHKCAHLEALGRYPNWWAIQASSSLWEPQTVRKAIVQEVQSGKPLCLQITSIVFIQFLKNV